MERKTLEVAGYQSSLAESEMLSITPLVGSAQLNQKNDQGIRRILGLALGSIEGNYVERKNCI